MKKHKIFYITYQTFPAETANSHQTISNIKYLIKNNSDVQLIFPLREERSSDSLSEIKKYYNIEENFKVIGLSHNLPFGKVQSFKKITFHVSHYLWARKTIKEISRNSSEKDVFITRSDWVFYFLLKNNKKAIFECHQLSKLRKIIIKFSLKKTGAKVIFLNNKLREAFSSNLSKKNNIVLQNGVDLDYFNDLTKKKKEIVFVGGLKRFNEERNINFIIEGFTKSKLRDSHKLKIIGGPNDIAKKIRENIKKISSDLDIEITGRLKRKKALENIAKAEIGIMINSSENKHSFLHTSPLKYYEYLASELIIIAIDFPAHRNLPYSENILFFNENNLSSLINCFNDAEGKQALNIDKEEISLNKRAKKILEFIDK